MHLIHSDRLGIVRERLQAEILAFNVHLPGDLVVNLAHYAVPAGLCDAIQPCGNHIALLHANS